MRCLFATRRHGELHECLIAMKKNKQRKIIVNNHNTFFLKIQRRINDNRPQIKIWYRWGIAIFLISHPFPPPPPPKKKYIYIYIYIQHNKRIWSHSPFFSPIIRGMYIFLREKRLWAIILPPAESFRRKTIENSIFKILNVLVKRCSA